MSTAPAESSPPAQAAAPPPPPPSTAANANPNQDALPPAQQQQQPEATSSPSKKSKSGKRGDSSISPRTSRSRREREIAAVLASRAVVQPRVISEQELHDRELLWNPHPSDYDEKLAKLKMPPITPRKDTSPPKVAVAPSLQRNATWGEQARSAAAIWLEQSQQQFSHLAPQKAPFEVPPVHVARSGARGVLALELPNNHSGSTSPHGTSSRGAPLSSSARTSGGTAKHASTSGKQQPPPSAAGDQRSAEAAPQKTPPAQKHEPEKQPQPAGNAAGDHPAAASDAVQSAPAAADSTAASS